MGDLHVEATGAEKWNIKEEEHEVQNQESNKTQMEHHEVTAEDKATYEDLKCVNSQFVVIKMEPEDTEVCVQSGINQDGMLAREDEPNPFPNTLPKEEVDYNHETGTYNSLQEIKKEPSTVIVKTEPDEPQVLMKVPDVSTRCKTELNAKDEPYSVYTSHDQQPQIQRWSVQCADSEKTGENSHLNTGQASDKQKPGEGKNGKRKQNSKKQKRLKSYSCTECGKTFSKYSCFNSHRIRHRRKQRLQCSYCDKSYSDPNAFKHHQRTHTGEKPYQCPECSKFFTRKDVLQIHQRTHTGERPYNCGQCGKAFTRLHIFRIHQRTHTGEKPYHCPQCGKTFTRIDSYQIHQRVHTGEKPYPCSVCEKRFLNLSNLNNHKRTHTKERPYKCPLCDKTFIQSGHIAKHQKTHTQGNP